AKYDKFSATIWGYSTIGIRTVTPPVFLYDHFTPFCLPVTPHRKTQVIISKLMFLSFDAIPRIIYGI
ncbi:MAG: hypothetical protein AAF629_30125, partial [Chloroflexota bacterium]